jgi:hypothetical protein
MYLTAQRVVAPSGGKSGINAFYYEHGRSWRVPPPGVPDRDPGSLVRERVEVRPPGNRVRSYVDLVTPDGMGLPEIQQRFVTFLTTAKGTSLPWTGIDGPCLFRVGMEQALARQWRHELAALLTASESLYVSAGSDPKAKSTS